MNFKKPHIDDVVYYAQVTASIILVVVALVMAFMVFYKVFFTKPNPQEHKSKCCCECNNI